MTKLKNSNCDKTQKPQIVTKLKNSNCDKSKKNSSFDKTQTLKLWQNSKTEIAIKIKKIILTNLKTWVVTTQKLNCEKSQSVTKPKNIIVKNSKTQFVPKLKNSICDKTQNFKLWQNSKTQMVTKFKNYFCDQTQKPKLWQNSKLGQN